MNFNDLEKKLKEILDNIVQKNVMDQVAEIAKDAVFKRTKKGFGVNAAEGVKKKLKPLTNAYKRQRQKLKRQNKLAGDTTPNKSNVTKSGDMLDDLDTKSARAEAEVFLKSEKSNKKAELQEKEGRKFMNLSKTEVREITKFLEQKLLNDINKKGL